MDRNHVTTAAVSLSIILLSLSAVAEDLGCRPAAKHLYSRFVAKMSEESLSDKSLPTCAPGYKCRYLEFFDAVARVYPNADLAPDPHALKSETPATQTRFVTSMKVCPTCTAAEQNGNFYKIDVTSNKGMRPGDDATTTTYNFVFNWDHNNCRLNDVAIKEGDKTLHINDDMCQGYKKLTAAAPDTDVEHPGFSSQKLQEICQAISSAIKGGDAYIAAAPAGFAPSGPPPGFQNTAPAPH